MLHMHDVHVVWRRFILVGWFHEESPRMQCAESIDERYTSLILKHRYVQCRHHAAAESLLALQRPQHLHEEKEERHSHQPDSRPECVECEAQMSSLADTNRHHAVLLLRMNAGLVRVIGKSEATTEAAATTLTIYHLATRVLLRLVNLVLAFNTQNSILELHMNVRGRQTGRIHQLVEPEIHCHIDCDTMSARTSSHEETGPSVLGASSSVLRRAS